MNSRPWHIAVVIPARNEEALLPRCLESVLDACASLPESTTVDIVVACDSSTDLTFQIAKQLLATQGCVVAMEAGAVGRARALATEVVFKRYAGPLSHCWLANTDADCCVPRSWLADQLQLAMEGIQAVAGIVDVDSFGEHEMGVDMRFRNSYLIHPDGSHPHVHGANLGVRADAYLLAGGWKGIDTGEDHDLWGRLIATAARRASTAAVKVLTSGRRVGRAPRGFADALAAHNEMVV